MINGSLNTEKIMNDKVTIAMRFLKPIDSKIVITLSYFTYLENVIILRLNHSCFKNENSEDLFLIHFNIRSLQKHIDELTTYFSSFKIIRKL